MVHAKFDLIYAYKNRGLFCAGFHENSMTSCADLIYQISLK